jgi:hypothetical protein
MPHTMLLVNLPAFTLVVFCAGFALGVAVGSMLERYLKHRLDR